MSVVEAFTELSCYEKTEVIGAIVSVVTLVCKAAVEIATIHADKKEIAAK